MLEQLASPYRSLAIAGLCKNAGKTTVLNYLLDVASPSGLAVTSIGRDGETTDRVTGTSKPRIWLRRGTLFATARGLLSECDLTREVLDTTDMPTPMGEVVIVRALSDGYVQLAGPSMLSQLVELSQQMTALGAERLLVDGAISRKTFCSPRLAEGIILCTGASCGRDMEAVVAEMAHVCGLMTLPRVETSIRGKIAETDSRVPLLIGGETVKLPAEMGLADGLRRHRNNENTTVWLPGAVTDHLLNPLVSQTGVDGLAIVVEEPGKILVSAALCAKLLARGIHFRVLERAELVAVTVNPVSAYGYHFGREEFCRRMSEAVSVPVVNVEDAR